MQGRFERGLEPGEGVFYLREQDIGDMESAFADADIDIGFGQAVEVAAACHQEAQRFGHAQIWAGLPGSVRAVVHLNSVQSGGFKLTRQIR